VPKDQLDKTAIYYRTFDLSSVETVRMAAKPSAIFILDKEIQQHKNLEAEGWTWRPLDKGGILTVRHDSGYSIKIMK
jgi:hypothetical protein